MSFPINSVQTQRWFPGPFRPLLGPCVWASGCTIAYMIPIKVVDGEQWGNITQYMNLAQLFVRPQKIWNMSKKHCSLPQGRFWMSQSKDWKSSTNQFYNPSSSNKTFSSLSPPRLALSSIQLNCPDQVLQHSPLYHRCTIGCVLQPKSQWPCFDFTEGFIFPSLSCIIDMWKYGTHGL